MAPAAAAASAQFTQRWPELKGEAWLTDVHDIASPYTPTTVIAQRFELGKDVSRVFAGIRG